MRAIKGSSANCTTMYSESKTTRYINIFIYACSKQLENVTSTCIEIGTLYLKNSYNYHALIKQPKCLRKWKCLSFWFDNYTLYTCN